MGAFEDLTGQKFHRLKVMPAYRVVNRNGRNRTYWLCKCDCGEFKEIGAYSLKYGRSKSCGCLQKETRGVATKTHGMTKTRFWNIWVNVKQRCSNVKHKFYNDYGGRGVTVCGSWLQFENFRDDMYESYLEHVEEFGERDTTIERIDNNGNYCKENCKWATRIEQANNKRLINWDLVTFCHQKYFKAISPQGIKYVSNNQRGFAREHQLDVSNIGKCLHGKRSHVEGYTFQYLTQQEIQQLQDLGEI